MAENTNPLDSYAAKYRKPATGDTESVNPLDAFAAKYRKAAQSTPATDGNILSDTATDLKAGVLKTPGMLAGLADIPAGLVGLDRPVDKLTDKIGEATGFTPGKWAEEAQKTGYSPERQQSDQNVQNAWDAYDKGEQTLTGAIGETLSNPRTLLGNTVESLPSIVAGGLGGKALLGAKALAPALGEGAVMAGQQMENIDGSVDPQKAAALSLGTGAIGAGLGLAGGKVAQKAGWVDPESAIGGIAQQAVPGKPLSTPARIAGGAASEGLLEELPQSIVEQGAQNIAEDKPLTQDMARSAVQGALSGGLMGGAFNVVKVSPTTGEEIPPETETSGPLGDALNAGAVTTKVDYQAVIDGQFKTGGYNPLAGAWEVPTAKAIETPELDEVNQWLSGTGRSIGDINEFLDYLDSKGLKDTDFSDDELLAEMLKWEKNKLSPQNEPSNSKLGDWTTPEAKPYYDGTFNNKEDAERHIDEFGLKGRKPIQNANGRWDVSLETEKQDDQNPVTPAETQAAQSEVTPTGDIPTPESTISPQSEEVKTDEKQSADQSTGQQGKGQEGLLKPFKPTHLLNDGTPVIEGEDSFGKYWQSEDGNQFDGTEPATPVTEDSNEQSQNKTPQATEEKIKAPWEGINQDSTRWHGSRVEIQPQLKGDTVKQGTVKTVLKGSSSPIVEVQIDGSDSTFRYTPDQLKVLSVVDNEQSQDTAPQAAPTEETVSQSPTLDETLDTTGDKTGGMVSNQTPDNKERDRIATLHAQAKLDKYGDTHAFDKPSETDYSFADNILNKNAYGLEHLSNGMNDAGKKAFEQATGIKLPKQQGETWKALRDWAGITDAQDAKEKAHRKVSQQFKLLKKLTNDAADIRAWIHDRLNEGFTRFEKQGGKSLLMNDKGDGFDLSKRGAKFNQMFGLLQAEIELFNAAKAVKAEEDAKAQSKPSQEQDDRLQYLRDAGFKDINTVDDLRLAVRNEEIKHNSTQVLNDRDNTLETLKRALDDIESEKPSTVDNKPTETQETDKPDKKTREYYLNDPEFVKFLKGNKTEFNFGEVDQNNEPVWETLTYERGLYKLDKMISQFKGFIACMG